MNLKICCDSKVELNSFNNIYDVKANIKNYFLENKKLQGNVIITGTYINTDDERQGFEKEVPFTIVFTNKNYFISKVSIVNFKSFDIVNTGIECSFDITVEYDENEINEQIVEDEKQNIVEENIVNETTTEEKPENEEIVYDDYYDEVEIDKNEESIDEIKEKYDELLNDIFNKRNDNIEIKSFTSVNDKTKDNVEITNTKDTEKVKLFHIGEKRSGYSVYYPKQENEIDRICKEEKVSINTIYNNSSNKDFINKKRIIVERIEK